jgi:outer membrane lipoprotein-sorting protein
VRPIMWVSARFWSAIIPLSALLVALASPGLAQSNQVFDPNAREVPRLGTPLGADEQAILLGEIERYFDTVDTLGSRFVQFNMDGSVFQGDLIIDRPGKMRIDYDDPVPYLIIADGDFYIFVDEQLEEASHIPIGLTPAHMLLRQPMRLGDELTVLDAARDSGALFITVAQKEAEDAGTLTLAFQEEPLSLEQWTVIDAQGIVTRVMLIDPALGVETDPEDFVFVNPWTVRQGGN